MAPGITLIALVSEAPGTRELKELSLAINTPDGIVLVVGCSHPGIDKIVEAAATINPKIHLRSRPDRVRAPSKDAVKHQRSAPRISSAIAGWLLVKTRSGSLPGEGNLPIETVMALNAKTAKAPALTVPPSMV